MSARDQATARQRPYLLSEEDHQYYYQEFIQKAYLDISDSPIPPVAYFLGAQPGSGKTKLRVGLQTGAEVIINTDELRWIHPSYSALLEEQQTNEVAGHLVNPDATDWSIRLRNDAIEERRSIIVDSTLGGTVQHFIELFQKLYNLGYIIEIHIIGVNINVSRLGVHYRFENGSRVGAPERMVSMEVHNRNYHTLPENLLSIGKACGLLVSRVVLYSRDGNDKLNDVYETDHPCDFQEVVTQLTLTRERPFSYKEQEDFKNRVENVRRMIEERGGDPQKFLRDIGDI